ncbi:MAG: hypothetical protein FJZ79_08570 [Chlorobi bacterium]|nr:hypothetical protein [Chlorobiota bacterium]
MPINHFHITTYTVEKLFEETGRERHPAVDLVRCAAKAAWATERAEAEAQASVATERQQDAVRRLETVLAELESVKQESRTALDKAQQETAEAREHAAGLAGQQRQLRPRTGS